MAKTKIQWCSRPRPDATLMPGYSFNSWRGCVKVSAGCKNCYAEAGSKINPGMLGTWGPSGTRVVASQAMWLEPFKWQQQAERLGETHLVFTLSYGDFFEAWDGPMVNSAGERLWVVPGGRWLPGTMEDCHAEGCRPLTMEDCRLRALSLFRLTPNLEWLLLTKRIKRARDFWMTQHISPNVRQGVSIEDQATADERLPVLLQIDAPNFVSLEPMLGPVDLSRYTERVTHRCVGGSCSFNRGRPDCPLCHGTTWMRSPRRIANWVIVGGESGHDARPFDLAWGRQVRDQCRAAGVPFFMKQMGSNVLVHADSGWPLGPTRLESYGECVGMKFADSHGGDPLEWPAEDRVREFPQPIGVPA